MSKITAILMVTALLGSVTVGDVVYNAVQSHNQTAAQIAKKHKHHVNVIYLAAPSYKIPNSKTPGYLVKLVAPNVKP